MTLRFSHRTHQALKPSIPQNKRTEFYRSQSMLLSSLKVHHVGISWVQPPWMGTSLKYRAKHTNHLTPRDNLDHHRSKWTQEEDARLNPDPGKNTIILIMPPTGEFSPFPPITQQLPTTEVKTNTRFLRETWSQSAASFQTAARAA